MKTIYKVKNKLRWVVVLLITACLLVIGGFLLGEKPKTVAFAAETETDTITFEQGASVRLDAEGGTSGLRFTANLTNDLYEKLTENGALKENAVLGMMIVPQSYVEAYENADATNYLEFFVTKSGIEQSKITINFTAGMLDKTATGYQMRGSLINIYPQNYERAFRAIAYYSLENNPTDTSFENYQYFINQEARSVSKVSALAIQNESKDKPYTEEELDILYRHTGGAIPRVLYDASKSEHAELFTTNSDAVEVTQEQSAFVFSLTEEPKDQVLIITPEVLANANLGNYEGGNIYFTVKTDISGATCSVTGGSTVTLSQGEEMTISVPFSSDTENFSITIRGLTAGADVWISDIAVCVKHALTNWVYPTADTHNGECSICNAVIEGTHSFTTWENPDNDHHTQSCSVCNKQTQGECTYENRECTVCDQKEWDTYVFAVLDDENTLHIFNRKVDAKPKDGTVLTLDDGSTLKVTNSNLYGVPYYTEQDDTLKEKIYSYVNNDEIGFEYVSKEKKGWDTAREAVKVIVEDKTSPKHTKFWFQSFSNCISMDLSKLDTSNVTDMGSMFDNCSSLTTLDVSNFNTENVTNMGSMFGRCTNLTELDLSAFDVANVTNMSSMFGSCGSLKSLKANFNALSVTSMSNMFYECVSLTSLDLLSFNTKEITTTYRMFYCCSSLTKLDLSGFNTESLTVMQGMFHGCTNLTVLDLGNFDTSNVEDMLGMFDGCRSLNALELGKNFNTGKIRATTSMFQNCSSLTTLDVSKFNTENVTDMRGMFQNCSSLTTLDVSNFNTENVTDMNHMFAGCSSLTSLDLSGFNTEKIDGKGKSVIEDGKTVYYCSMEGMFQNCSSLTSLDLRSFNTSKVTCMAFMFDGCSSLTSLNVSSFDTQVLESTEAMFRNCSRLEILDLRSFSATKMGNGGSASQMFADCTSLKRIIVDDSWNIGIWFYMVTTKDVFTGCTNIIGGNGTTYDATKVDSDQMYIDGNALPIWGTTNHYFTSETQAKNLGLL